MFKKLVGGVAGKPTVSYQAAALGAGILGYCVWEYHDEKQKKLEENSKPQGFTEKERQQWNVRVLAEATSKK
jgi:hypothetical protein